MDNLRLGAQHIKNKKNINKIWAVFPKKKTEELNYKENSQSNQIEFSPNFRACRRKSKKQSKKPTFEE